MSKNDIVLVCKRKYEWTPLFPENGEYIPKCYSKYKENKGKKDIFYDKNKPNKKIPLNHKEPII